MAILSRRESRSVVFLPLLFYFSVVGADVKFTKEPSDPSYVNNGSNATLVWDYSDTNNAFRGILFNVLVDGQNGKEYKPMLYKQNGGLKIHQNIPPLYKGRVRLEGNATLVIENVTPKDNTKFQCELTGSLTHRSAVTLIIAEAPKITLSTIEKGYLEGSFVNISCTASGKPDPDVTWIRKGKVKTSGKKASILIFNRINRTEEGTYTCRANNSVTSSTHSTTLEVHYKPEGVTLTTSPAQNTVTQGDRVTLTCCVTVAKPQVSGYKFYLYTRLVSNSSNSEYTISSVNRSQHSGKYKCVPYNEAGDGPGVTVTLNISVPVQFKKVLQNITVNISTPIFLSCDASGFPTPYVRWTKSEKTLSDKKQLHISSSNKSDAGEYMCTVGNGVGQEKSARAYVTVQYPPKIQIASVSSPTSWVGQTVTLKCQSNGVPVPTLTWYQPDGDELKRETNKEIKANVALNDSSDFGDYKCVAENGLTPPDEKTVNINQIKKPGQATIISTEADVQASSLAVRWTAPADDGGSPITAYRVIILKGDTKKGSVNITGFPKTNHTFKGLERDTNYTVKVFARNSVFEGDAVVKTLKTKFEGPPEVVKIDELPIETKDDSITLKWKKPGHNGKVITQYTVYQRMVTDGKVGDWKEIRKITNVKDRYLEVKLKKGEVYEFAITATNALGEGLKQDASKIKRVKGIGIPEAVEIYGLPKKATEDTITLRWIEPKDNGKKITEYTVYQRTMVDGRPGDWKMIKEISDVKVREIKVKLERGKVYQFAVTATNGVGESLKPDEKQIPQIKAVGSPGSTKGSPVGGENGMNTAIYSGAAVAGVLLIIGIIVIIVLWRRRKPSSPGNDEMAMDGLDSANHYEADDGYHEVSRAEAARRLQASGSDAEANYAQVDMTRKKKNRPPPPDEYAQVDKSKKTKKRQKRPGELDYADLEDLRVGLVPGPSSATAAAAVVRPPAYEGTDYADIAQFGVPQPDPTYANVSKGDVTYSNMQSIT
ncbi:twitchin-like isoform X1 [Stylophora pistillata]|uniref:twitchin-like isoform X1 n=1 Tax=Stylophora pistillata TaxID=50429 RepID=UPI000C050AB0|nr:twitchin-like isoform X1 [Stylophora pistillata]